MDPLIATALDTARARGAEYADIRLVSNREQRIVVRNGVVETMTADESVGLGIRAVYRGAWGLASTWTQLTAKVPFSTIKPPAYGSMSRKMESLTMTTIRELQDRSKTLHGEAIRASQSGQQAEARSKAWQAALSVIEAATLSERWGLGPEQTPAETVLRFSLKTKDRRIFTLFASAEALDPDTFIEAIDSEDLHERVTFTGEFIQRMSRHLSG